MKKWVILWVVLSLLLGCLYAAFVPGGALNRHQWVSDLPAMVGDRRGIEFIRIQVRCPTPEWVPEGKAEWYADVTFDICVRHGEVRVLKAKLPDRGFQCQE